MGRLILFFGVHYFRYVKKILLAFSTILIFGLCHGQKDSTPEDSLVIEKSKQQIYFGFDLNGSIPIGDFADDDINNTTAGFADPGFGGGLFANFYWNSGLFMKINLDYTYRSSTLTDGGVELINEDLIGNPARTIDNPDYHHGTVTAAGGYNLKWKNAELYAMAEVGYAFSYFTESSYRSASGMEIKFDDSSDNTLCYGGGIGGVFFERYLLEVAYLNLGEPVFQSFDNVDESQFALPMETIRAKIGFVLIR